MNKQRVRWYELNVMLFMLVWALPVCAPTLETRASAAAAQAIAQVTQMAGALPTNTFASGSSPLMMPTPSPVPVTATKSIPALSPAPTESWTDYAGEQIWSYTSEGMNGGSIVPLAISPNFVNDQTVFAAAGPRADYPFGIFKSTDGGTSWAWVFRDIPVPIVDIALSPNYAVDQTVFVLTNLFGGRISGIILRSDDGGINWEYISECNSGSLSTIVFSPDYANDQTIFVGNHVGYFCKSIDGGVSWQTVGRPTSLPMVLAISPNYANDQTLFAAHGGILKSTDGGESWTTSLPNLYPRGTKTLAISPAFASDSTVFVGTYDDGVFKTTDAGESWVQVNDGLPYGDGLHNGDIRALVISPNFTSDQTIFAVTDGEGVFKSINGGDSWESIETPAQDVYDLALSPNYANDQIIYLGTDEGVYKAEDNGATWNLTIDGITAVIVQDLEVSPDFATAGTVFAGTNKGVFKSSDGGISWALKGFDGLGVRIELSPDFATDQTIFASVGDSLFKSIDAGESWGLVATGVLEGLVVSPNYPNDDTIFAYSEGEGVFKSVDDGVSWSAVNNGLTSLEISALAISPNYANDQTLIAGTFFSGPDGGVFRSTDGGTSWTRLDVATNYNPMVSAIAFSPAYAIDQTLFVSQSFLMNFLHKSSDRGDTWTTVHAGISANNIVLSSYYLYDQTLYVGTGDNSGVFVSHNGGATWATMNDGLSTLYAASSDLAITPTSPATLFAGYLGVWQYTTIEVLEWKLYLPLALRNYP